MRSGAICRSHSLINSFSLQAILAFFAGNLQAAAYYCSLVARLLYSLGAHVAPNLIPDTPESRVKWQLRNIFWLCYVFDKDLAMRTGQPGVIANENCDLTLPIGYLEALHSPLTIMGPEWSPEELPPSCPIYPTDIRLCIIEGRAFSEVYSFQAQRKTDAELLKDIRVLDDELERWRVSMPSDLRPPLLFPSNQNSNGNGLQPAPKHLGSLIMHLAFYLCVTVIHLASNRCRERSNNLCGIMQAGISSSLALSVEASRSTLRCLQASERVFMQTSFG